MVNSNTDDFNTSKIKYEEANNLQISFYTNKIKDLEEKNKKLSENYTIQLENLKSSIIDNGSRSLISSVNNKKNKVNTYDSHMNLSIENKKTKSSHYKTPNINTCNKISNPSFTLINKFGDYSFESFRPSSNRTKLTPLKK